MSRHYSKYALNSYNHTPYFEAHIPAGYPVNLTLMHARAFRRLPPTLMLLAMKSREWAAANGQLLDGIDKWYDSMGHELDPDTGHRLTDKEIDAEWTPDLAVDTLIVRDIPVPNGGFPDPKKWKPPAPTGATTTPTKQQLLDDVAAQGLAATEAYYGLDLKVVIEEEPDDSTFDEAQKHFEKRSAKVLGSSYFAGRGEELKILQHYLKTASIYSDLWGHAEVIFRRAEEYEEVKNSQD